MKKDKRMQSIYQKQMEERLRKVEEQILNDSLTNPLLKRAGEVPAYFRDWIDGSKLVAVIPALDRGSPNANSYYSVGAICDGVEQDLIRVSPVFMYINEDFIDISEENEDRTKKSFIFDSEHDKLYKYEKIPHSQKSHFVKKPDFERMKQHIVDNPVVLFFYGCDDGHVGKRFKTEKDAFEYLELLEVFEDVFDEDLQNHN